MSQPELGLFHYWYTSKGWTIYDFQQDVYEAYSQGKSGLLNAPTGSGKTYALWIPILDTFFKSKEKKQILPRKLNVLWITPVRALVNDISKAMQTAVDWLEVDWKIASRTGDTPDAERRKQKIQTPDCLITTPESLQLMFTQKGYSTYFADLQAVIVDEWHELMGNKRGTQVELALSRIRAIVPDIQIWGITATLSNAQDALECLVGVDPNRLQKATIVRSTIKKKIEVQTLLPEKIETFPWGGHMGLNLLSQLIPIIEQAQTCLIFTNTRAQSEIWYQAILEQKPEWAGMLALHHGSLSAEVRLWVESALHQKMLKAVVCTSSLDLGVDFRPVDTVIQIGGPKGVARFIQRAGRSGHQPNQTSTIYFVPTHALEIVESTALQQAIHDEIVEERPPQTNPYDVLIQYLVTLSISEGFDPKQIWHEIKQTKAFQFLEDGEWYEILEFITKGGKSLSAYDDYRKVHIVQGKFYITSRKLAMMHRLNIGTIVSEQLIRVVFANGNLVGHVEDYFSSKLKTGDLFTFAGKNLEVLSQTMTELRVRVFTKKTSNVPSYQGGRMQLSSNLSKIIRAQWKQIQSTEIQDKAMYKREWTCLMPLVYQQMTQSIIPKDSEFLIETLKSKEGNHLFFYTFEGRNVNEGLAALVSYRIAQLQPMSFSISMTDYGFELLSAQPIPLQEALEIDLFRAQNVAHEIMSGLNQAEMTRKKFAHIAQIAGLIFQGYPGKELKTRHLKASAKNFYEVFATYEPNHILLRQAYMEVLQDQLDEMRIMEALKRIQTQKIVLKRLEKPSPFCFPIMVERIRSFATHETVEAIVERLLHKNEFFIYEN